MMLTDRPWRIFLRRFDLEHTFRFLQQTLGPTRPRLRHPEQADRWVWPVLSAYTRLRLARPLADDLRRPWEKPMPPHRLTPGRTRRGHRRIRQILGTPAKPRHPTRPRPHHQAAPPAPHHVTPSAKTTEKGQPPA
ncbi:hypothetical protein [Streptomyces sp. NPDC005533]|uniref:hypothetical protein n=1 Tax=Streptomyces sp. NPDC005533 TaxID=3364723 RepID=UPI0036A8A006